MPGNLGLAWVLGSPLLCFLVCWFVAMTDSQIDAAVLAVVEPSWRKVAMIISKVAHQLGGDLPEGDAGYHSIAGRIEALVRDGSLVTQGDIKNWRHSEVRRP